MKRGERPPSKRGELSSSSSQRSVSPIGLGAILKPTKWFQRSNSSKSNLSTTVETRTSLTKISNPTNPRPSVLSLSMNRSTSQLAVSIPQSSSGSTHSGSGIGDLRAASGKKWSKSVDDLSKFSPDSPISPSSLFSARIGEYRSGALQSPSSTLLPSTQTPARPPLSAGPGTVAFPTKASAVDEEGTNSKKHGRSLSFGRLHPSHPQPITSAAAPVPTPRLPTKSITSLKAAQAANARAAHQMVTSLNPAGAPSRPSYERSLGSTEKSTAGAGGTNPGYNVRTFGFPFGMTHKPSTSPPQIVLFSALESGSNATLATTKASKRSSQMVIHQGFLMRLDHPTQPEKGKPFKGCRTQRTIPEGLVAQGIEEEEEEEAESASPGGAVTNRTKRKYWGRAQHPELQIVGEDKELQGTLDALVHEIVFGTTFDSQLEKETFAQVVLLCLPNVLPQHSDFDEALIRYLGSAFRTLGQDDRCGDSTEERKTKEKEWLEWLVGTYVLLHGGLAGDGEASGALVASPYVGVFSPRPNEAGAFESIPTHSPRLAPSISTHALVLPPGTVVPVNAITSDTISEFFSRPSKLGNTLDRDRLSRDVFLKVPSATIAKALRVLNQVFLVQAVQGWGRAPITYGGHELPASDTAGSIGVAAGHGVGIIPEGVKVSRTHTRAAVLCKWIRLGELARVNGDECTWRAVQAAVCSRAIARLERVFRRMSDEEREIVSAWARDDRHHPPDYKCTPWESNVRERIAQEMVRARLKGGELWHVKPFENAWSMVQAMGVTWNKCTGGVLPLGDSDVEDVIGLVRYFRRHAEDEELVRSKHIADYNGLSFAIEPRRNRYYAPHFFRNKGTLSTHPLMPLLFPELMPAVTMLDRTHIVRGKKVSATSHTEGTGPVEMTQEHIQEVVTRTRAFQSGGQGQSKGKEVRLLGEDLGETTLTVFSGELVLKLVKEEKGTGERALSRSTTMLRNVSRPASLVEEDGLEGLSASLSGILSPNSSGVLSPGSAALRLERKPSRNPSIRATPSSHLERKQSAIRSRRSSLPSISQRASLVVTEASGEPPLRALVSSGSLEKLVDVLISGLEEVGMQTSPADDNGETSLREGRTRGVRVDHGEYCRIFWGMFRSFVTPMVLFEMIQKRYRNAANKKSFTSSSLARFSSHSNPDGNPEDDQYRNEIIQTLTNWIVEGAGGQDLLDDTDFYGAMHRFLFDSEVPQLNGLRELFKRVTRRPNMETPSVPSAGHSSTGFGSTVPTLDDIDPETLADNLDAIAAAALKPVTLTDLIVALDLFETQSVDKLGWYAVSDLPPTGDDTPIQNIYTQLQDVDTSPLISEMGPEKFVRNLPSSIRSVFRAHDIVRRWALASIVTPRLEYRLRTADSPSSQDILQPSIRTFTETALGAALCSPESRLFTRAWQEVGAARGASIDSLSSLLSVRRVEKIRSPRRMTADMGWLIECLLELSCLPDKSCEGGSGVELLNFDKRRYLFNLMSNVPNLQPLRKQQMRSNTHRADVDRMTNMQREVSESYYEPRVIREEAYRENMQSSPHHAPPRKAVRPFHRLVAEQNEKNRRDKYARERLQKEIKNEKMISGRRDDNINKAMLPKGGHGQRKKSRSMSGFFTMLRPISSAWSGDKFQDKIMKPRTLQELDFEPTGKPSVVVNVASAQVQDAVNTHRSFVMRLRTEDGVLFYLQALDHHDATRWLNVLQETSSTYARRRLTYQGGKSDALEAGVPSFNTTTKHPNPVYGVPWRNYWSVNMDFLHLPMLSHILSRSVYRKWKVEGSPSRAFVRTASIDIIHPIDVSIDRLVPSTTELAQLRDMFDSGAAFEGKLDPHTDIMAYTSALKAWFRSLPECAFTDALYNDFIAAARELDGNAKAARLQELVLSLPSANFHLLRVMFEHLDHAENVATCLAQSMIFPPGGTGGSIFPINLGEHHQLVKCLIIQSNQVFQQLGEEVEPEAPEEVHRYEDIIEEQAIDSDSEEGLEEIPITRASTTRLDMFEDDIFSAGTTQRANEAWVANELVHDCYLHFFNFLRTLFCWSELHTGFVQLATVFWDSPFLPCVFQGYLYPYLLLRTPLYV
ncbi:GTPase-activator protein for Rho-like GTPases [Rhizoctonia solani]|uniref:GTPase-activator protein for Rho-like GTPases n=1 Tax=Rhizoctonia solani TaxID=456999 RepID=A0A8H7I320_9AGAM|nr:GTPase-activator protein for Rho-like GTPases [Rhizoctonia solani]